MVVAQPGFGVLRSCAAVLVVEPLCRRAIGGLVGIMITPCIHHDGRPRNCTPALPLLQAYHDCAAYKSGLRLAHCTQYEGEPGLLPVRTTSSTTA